MIVVENLSVQAGKFSLRDCNFMVPSGKYSVLMGRTGSGKTTVLETVCGLRSLLSGRVSLDGRDVTGLRPAARGVGFVPQDGALFPNMTVYEHLAFALRIRGWSRPAIKQRVEETAAMVGVTPLLDRRPHGLSGGETQRVALGRALSFRPRILCLDEPLSSLDEDSRKEMCQLLKSVQQETGVTALHVTHSRWEAEMLADQLLELVDGDVRESKRDPKA